MARTGDSVVTLEELAAAIDPGERRESSPPAAETGSLTNVRAGLYHVHLPKLDEAAVVEYTPDSGEVRTGMAFPIALDLLRAVEPLEYAPDTDLDGEFER
ncbi:hypothetical protein HUG10_12695 [Halorarum halophilum]|uniref:DUF7344 domain-containing protein n=1 Tax=Halorarum halophilum TaxID=2743090 RepID=A0A7D5GCN3_9EURY|nr:hypothetical protein [Halobaculum halophilum]QLG28352.1 hypothetical protein HUG10_12695 [Halobaculum halophilum]